MRLPTLKEFIEDHRLDMELVKVPFRTDIDQSEWDKEATHWAFQIYKKRMGQEGYTDYRIKGYFSQGSAIKTKPTIEDILNSLMLDTIDLDPGFKDWADSLGYSDDSLKAQRIYFACLEEQARLKKLFTSKELARLYECESL